MELTPTMIENKQNHFPTTQWLRFRIIKSQWIPVNSTSKISKG